MHDLAPLLVFRPHEGAGLLRSHRRRVEALLQEAVATIDAGSAGLIMHDHADIAGASDQIRHLVGSEARGGQVIGGAGRQRNVTVDARVEADLLVGQDGIPRAVRVNRQF